jgi:hypothetical protein
LLRCQFAFPFYIRFLDSFVRHTHTPQRKYFV